MDASAHSDRILVGVDGSEPSIEALRQAARLAIAFDRPIEAVTTWTFPAFTSPYVAMEWDPAKDAAAALDAAVAEAFGDDPPARLTRTVVAGPAASTLIDMSESASLLVLGSRGHGGFAGLLLGSVSAACAEHAHCSVLIARSRPESVEA